MDEERASQVRNALLKGAGAIAVIAVVIALGTTLLVRALGLDGDGSDGEPVGADADSSPSALPTTAIPQPRDEEESPTETPSESPSPTDEPVGRDSDIQLDVSPVIARPMERINLTGTYKGADAVQLQVQRFDDGTWTDFDAKTTVRVGTFATYIMTGRAGENRFRVYDPQADKGSNVILVTIE